MLLTSAYAAPLETLRFVETAILLHNRSLWATWQELWLQGVSVEMGILGDLVRCMRNLIEIALFRDQQADEHYSSKLLQLLATYRSMVNGGDVGFLWESWQRLGLVRAEAVEQGLLAGER
jgi:hypothetical protein